MTKKDFCKLYSDKTGVTQRDAAIYVDAFRDTLAEALLKDGAVRLKNFMSVELVDVPEREGRNPRTGETLTIPDHKRVKVKINDNFTAEVQ